MKPALICAAVLVASLMYTTESQAQYRFGGGFGGAYPSYGSGNWFGGSFYSLGSVPVPPYFALHPPVYYSHEIIRRPMGDSPFAYLPRRPAPPAPRQFSTNPFVPDVIIEPGPQKATRVEDTVANVVRNPFYADDQQTLIASQLIVNPYYVEPETLVTHASKQ